MIQKLWPYARSYSPWIAAGVTCSACEAIFELLIPLVMSDIVDIGIATGDQAFILRKSVLMVFMALLVIPSIKISDKGLFDGDAFEFIDVIRN